MIKINKLKYNWKVMRQEPDMLVFYITMIFILLVGRNTKNQNNCKTFLSLI
jgi:hypothetical protein